MTSDILRFRFKGPTYDNHMIDIGELAPALIALGDLCTVTNRLFNDERVQVKVLIKANVEQHCFELGFELVQSVYDQLKGLFTDDNIATVNNILNWIGILSGGAGTVGVSTVGYLQFLKWLDGRKISNLKQAQEGIQVTVVGDNNTVMLINPHVAKMIGEPKLLDSAKSLSARIQKDGAESLEFEHNGLITETITKADAARINANSRDTMVFEVSADTESPPTKAWIKVYSPVYDPNAPKWRFRYGKNTEYIDISETTIAKDAIARGGAMVDDTYSVDLQITQKFTAAGEITNHYKILKVLNFIPAKQQGELFLHGLKKDDADESES